MFDNQHGSFRHQSHFNNVFDWEGLQDDGAQEKVEVS